MDWKARAYFCFRAVGRQIVHDIVGSQGMQQTTHSFWPRRAMALCISFLLSLASLMPLAAAAFSSQSDCSCCHSRNKCGMKMRAGRHSAGPAVTASSCQEACGALACGATMGNGLLRPAPRWAARSLRSVAGVLPFATHVTLRQGDNTLRQRPPPPAFRG
jgi:hypothetical protein